MAFLPMTPDELNRPADFVLVTGDAYVDHPSFGAAVIGRVLEDSGFTVGIIAQPDWKNPQSFNVFGKPRLGFLVTGGNIDSMVNHYTAAKKRRSKDSYSPGAKTDLRPDRALIVYCNKIRELYKEIAVIAGGLEASLRRLAHYDYWSDSVRRSCLLDSGADILVYGMGEHQIVEIAEALDSGIPVEQITFVNGTVYKTRDITELNNFVQLPSYDYIKTDKSKFNESFRIQYENTDAVTAKILVEQYGSIWVVQNTPSPPLSEKELDKVYSLKYERRVHPVYDAMGGVPAIDEVKFSLTSSRGCFGSCGFCALTFHQGRVVTSRSHKSLVSEAIKLTSEPDFKGYIHDVGGPTANFRKPSCKRQSVHGVCKNRQCLVPQACKNLDTDHSDYLSLLRKLRSLPRIKKVFIRSGLRYDYLIMDKNSEFFEELCKYHISGQLKVAPEHISARVLEKMNKPGREVYERFVQKFETVNRRLGLKQYLVPYLISSHPGSDLHAAVELAEYLRDMRISPEQVQDFYPTPATLSTCIYYTGADPFTGERVYVPSGREKAMQRALIQYKLPQNYELVYEALQKTDRQDLIGNGKRCLIRDKNNKYSNNKAREKNDKYGNDKLRDKNKKYSNNKIIDRNNKNKIKKK